MDTANTERGGKQSILEANERCLASVLKKEIHPLRLGHDIYLLAVYSILY